MLVKTHAEVDVLPTTGAREPRLRHLAEDVGLDQHHTTAERQRSLDVPVGDQLISRVVQYPLGLPVRHPLGLVKPLHEAKDHRVDRLAGREGQGRHNTLLVAPQPQEGRMRDLHVVVEEQNPVGAPGQRVVDHLLTGGSGQRIATGIGPADLQHAESAPIFLCGLHSPLVSTHGIQGGHRLQ